MSEKKYSDPYKHVSNIYSYLMDFISYKWWAKYIYTITKNKIPKNPFVLELAAGSGDMAKYLSRSYKNYYLSDLSLNMLKKSSTVLPKICCDMTALPIKINFDLIVSSFDSVNYLLGKKKLFKLFKEVRDHLTENGVFTFDAALESNSYKHQKTAITKGKTKGFVFERESRFYPKTKVHKNIFKLIDPDGRKSVEVHVQKIYSFETFFDLAEKSGLYIVNCYKAFSFTKGKPTSDRVQFIMRRKL